MFAVYAKFSNGEIDLIGFANTEPQVDRLVDQYITRNGADYLGSRGVQFNAELAA